MRYLSFSFSCACLPSEPDNTKDVHVRKLHLKSSRFTTARERASEKEILKMHQLLHIFHVLCTFACDRLTFRSVRLLFLRDPREEGIAFFGNVAQEE